MRKHLLTLVLGTVLAPLTLAAQSLDDLNIQIHGYATQGFLYTTQNNFFTTSSSNGSPEWSEAVLNLTAQPTPKLRVGVQARYFLLGNYSNEIDLDWAAADYKASDKFGVRFGKVKTPTGLFNETQDIDPSYMWALLPQGVYPLSSRQGQLAHYGGVVYGTLNLQKAGKLEYRGFAGEKKVNGNDGYFLSFVEAGVNLSSGIEGPVYGAALHWKAPVNGLMLGASIEHIQPETGPFTDTYIVPAGPSQGVTITTPGTLIISAITEPDVFGKFEKGRLMVAAEYERLPGTDWLQGLSPAPGRFDTRPWFAMATYKVSEKFSAGLYDSQDFSHASPLGPARYSKDWTLSGRYDFNQYLYAKADEHFIDGTSIGYDTDLNPGGLQPTTKLTVLKLGVSF